MVTLRVGLAASPRMAKEPLQSVKRQSLTTTVLRATVGVALPVVRSASIQLV